MIMALPMREDYVPDWCERLEKFLVNIIEKGSISYNADKMLRQIDNETDDLSIKGILNDFSYGHGILDTT